VVVVPLPGTPSLSLRDGERGVILRCWAGCDPRDVLAELRRLGLRSGGDEIRAAPIARRRNGDDDTARRIEAARRIWDRAQYAEADGSPVVPYLAARGITIPPPPSLRWAPALRRPDGSYGTAMVGLVEHAERGIVGLHRTFLGRDADGIWRRIERRSLGPIGGGAVRLAPAAETLLIGEGVETCLAATQATAQPAWAALSTSGLVALMLPTIVRTVVILADHDANGACERAARAAAARWLAEGRKVRIARPPIPGTDFNDVLMGRAHARITEATTDAAA
jgi:putative DNA primase/helicase